MWGRIERIKGSASEILATVLFLTAIRQLVSGDILGAVPGVPRWLTITVSILELLVAAELAVPRFRVLGGIGVFVVMIGLAVYILVGADVADPLNETLLVALNLAVAAWGYGAAWLVGGRHRGIRSLFTTAREQLVGQVLSAFRRGT